MAISNIIKLRMYNDALRLCGESALPSLQKESEVRHYLDDVWETAVDYCLEMGQWKFAIRSITLTYSPSVTVAYGFTRAFDKPADLIRTTGVYTGESFNSPLMDYRDEGPYWFASADDMWVSYVSNDDAYGYDSSLWPPTFMKLLAAHLALEVANNVKRDAPEGLYQRLERILHDRMLDAKSHDAMQGPTRFAPSGSWATTRGYGWGGDRGSRTRLIG